MKKICFPYLVLLLAALVACDSSFDVEPQKNHNTALPQTNGLSEAELKKSHNALVASAAKTAISAGVMSATNKLAEELEENKVSTVKKSLALYKKPLPPGQYSCPNRTEPIKLAAYVETNDTDTRNFAQLVLKESRLPLFDIVILFAPNMNYNEKEQKRYIHFNPELQPTLKNPDIYIRPLQDLGIKVLATLLPNYQGVGYDNFQSQSDADNFVRTEVKRYTDTLGIDGWDIDEEWADYKINSEKSRLNLYQKSSSIEWYVNAMKSIMPSKLLTSYGVGVRSDEAYAAQVDYYWASLKPNSNSVIPKEKYGPRVDHSSTDIILGGCYQQAFIFNVTLEHLKEGAQYKNSLLAIIAKAFYGEDLEFIGPGYKKEETPL